VGGVEVVASETGACSIVGVVVETGLGIAVDASGRVDDNIEACECGTASDAAPGGWVVGGDVLEEVDVEPDVLINNQVSDVGDGDEDVGSSRS
jgi:hypothetical protein